MYNEEIRLSFDGQANASFNNEMPYIIVELDEKIAVDKLEEAVFFAIDQHPTFHTRLVKKNKLYYLQYNEQLPVVREKTWDEKIEYGTEEYNRYPWIITVNGANLLFACAHLLCDGIGAKSFLSTVLTRYYYLLGAVSDGVMSKCTATEETKRRRCEDPFSVNRVQNAKAPYKLRKHKAPPRIKRSLIEKNDSKVSVMRFRIPEQEIIKLAQKTETTSFAVIASILAKSLHNMLDIQKGNIQIILPVNLREKYASETDFGFVHTANLYYDCQKFRGKSLELISTAFRSQLDLIINKDYLDCVVESYCRQMDLVIKHPIVLKLAMIAFYNMLYVPKASLVYTHLTKVDFGKEINEHIKDFYFSGTPASAGLIAVAATTFNNEISLTVGQSIKDQVLIKALEKVLEEYGVKYTLSKNQYIDKIAHKRNIH